MSIVIDGILIGIIATLVIDLLALVLRNVFRLPTANWGLVGRWVAHLRDGRFVHEPISDSTPVAGERAIGWMTHYVVGSVYGVTYLCIMTAVLSRAPAPASAALFGLATVAAPWLILQPGLGAGVFARRAPRPWVVRCTNVFVHVVFGLGLYLGWSVLGQSG